MRYLRLICGLSLVSLIRATPTLERKVDYVVHEKRVEHPASLRTRRLEGHTLLPLRIGLKQRNLDNLADYLMSVSDPNSQTYGQHWTPEKVVETFAPAKETHDTVRRWLLDAGVDARRVHRSVNNAWVEIPDATVAEIEQLLDTQYHVYKHEGSEHIACDSYSLPRSVAEVVDIVTPTVQPDVNLADLQNSAKNRRSWNHQKISRAPPNSTSPAGCDTNVTPDCLRALYNMTYTPQATDKNSFGIVSYFSNTYLQSDLDMFFRNFSPSLVGKSPALVSINGGSVDPVEGSAFSEDGWILEYAMTLTQPQPVMFLQVGGPQTGDIIPSFNQWLDAVDGSYCTFEGGDDFTYDPIIPSPFPGGLLKKDCGIIKPPHVVSNSQSDHENRFSQFYLQRQCNEFAKLGLMGTTVIYSSGNTGTTGPQSGLCLDDNGSMTYNGTKFLSGWPAACPWITAVGGTQVKANTTVARPGTEEVWNEEVAPGVFFSGGGGFSNRFPTPSYQKNNVENFLKNLKKNDPAQLKHFNNNGRAFPDLSANANHFVAAEDGEFTTDRGTSGAVPTVGSIVTLINDARIHAGKTPVGFINPAIHSPNFANAFNDITSGSSGGCKSIQGVRDGGFKAGKGWDPASGVGTPNLGLLIEKWLALP
ncbi:subtilisin-like protein [Collybia nuda]|uniref:Subtilisin-like protein n=1 Tax=Collybia nuda TaxID=64659 RepID=A0A9P5YD23_9AGAR|nr:subtilisin-like protein [Collybia nuda]